MSLSRAAVAVVSSVALGVWVPELIICGIAGGVAVHSVFDPRATSTGHLWWEASALGIIPLCLAGMKPLGMAGFVLTVASAWGGMWFRDHVHKPIFFPHFWLMQWHYDTFLSPPHNRE